MKLSLSIIRYFLKLQNAHILAKRKLYPDTMRLTGAALWTGGPIQNFELCYVMDARKLTAEFSCPANIALILIGSADASAFQNQNADIMAIDPGGLSFGECFNEIVRVFTYCADIEQRMSAYVARGAALKEFIPLGQMLFRNPIVVFDRNFCVLNPGDADEALELTRNHWSNEIMLSIDMINTIKMHPYYNHSQESQAAFYISDGFLPAGMLFSHYNQGNYEFTVCVIERTESIDASHYQLIEYFAKITQLILRSHNLSISHPISFEKFLRQLLNNEQIERAVADKYLHSMGWKYEDHYLCVTLQTNQWDRKNAVYHNICLNLENTFPQSFAFYYDSNIVMLINLDKGNLDRSTVIHRLSPFLRDQLFRAGISYSFWEFTTLISYYQQTLGALEMGMRYKPHEWSYPFEHYVLHYFMCYGSSKINGRHLCAPALVQLYMYDEENGTSLLQTLKVFLNMERNASLTAQALYIHRNTLYQRLEKIQALVHPDLDDPEIRLFYQISYALVEKLGLQPIGQLENQVPKI